MSKLNIEKVEVREHKKVFSPRGMARFFINWLTMLALRAANTMVIDTNGVQAVRGTNVGEVLLPNSVNSLTGNPAFLPGSGWGLTGPTRAYIINGPAGLGAEMLPGADNFHWLLKLFNPTTGAELAAGAYAALNLADVDFKVAFEGRNFD
jgi:hypothetical protein